MFGIINLKNETMLNIDAARMSARQISDQFLARGRSLVRVFGDEIEETLSLRFQI